MTYQTVMTVEKSGSKVKEIIANCPDWLDIEACFPYDSPFCEPGERVSPDGSYIEFFAIYPDQEVYELWYEAYHEIHNTARISVMAYLEAQGCTVNRYYQVTDLSQPEGVQPLDNLVPRDDLIETSRISTSMPLRYND
jgi:hypothetical protein